MPYRRRKSFCPDLPIAPLRGCRGAGARSRAPPPAGPPGLASARGWGAGSPALRPGVAPPRSPRRLRARGLLCRAWAGGRRGGTGAAVPGAGGRQPIGARHGNTGRRRRRRGWRIGQGTERSGGRGDGAGGGRPGWREERGEGGAGEGQGAGGAEEGRVEEGGVR